MNIDVIKKEIVAIHKKWDKLGHSLDDGQSFDDDKYAEMYEAGVWDMLVSYCENKEYEVEGYPFEKRLQGETDEAYDEDYFCFERNVKYVEVLATQKPDVLELLFFYKQTFWYDETASPERLKEELLEAIAGNWYDINF